MSEQVARSAGFVAIGNRLAMVHGLLSRIVPERRQQTALAQSNALQTLISRHSKSLDADEVAELTTAISTHTQLWHGHDVQLLGAFGASCFSSSDVAGKRKLQDCDSLLKLMVASDWELLADSSVPEKDFIVIQRMIRLGLKCPKEATMKLACCTSLTFSCEETTRISTADFQKAFRDFKKGFKQQLALQESADEEVRQLEYIESYPTKAKDLMSSCPLIWACSFGKQPPSACPEEPAITVSGHRNDCTIQWLIICYIRVQCHGPRWPQTVELCSHGCRADPPARWCWRKTKRLLRQRRWRCNSRCSCSSSR